VLINGVQMSNNLLKISDRNHPCPILAVRDLQNRVVIIKVKFSRGLGTGATSLYVTGLITDGRFGYFIVCLDLEVIPVMFVK